MTKTNTRSRIVSILLVFVMLLSLLPTTALAASPDASNVYVNGGIRFYNPTRLYYKNGDSDASFTGTSTDFNAAYDPATGTLTLKNYNGKGITVGGVGRTDITVVLIGTNTINGSLTNDVGGDITITSESGGTLSITNTLSGGNDAIGIETGLSASYTTGNVAITGDAKVTINMTNNATSTYERAYGIYAKENITISESASVDITCATPYNTTGGGNCNGLRAEKNVIIETNGTIKIDVTKAGKDDGYSFGVYPMGTAILTKVGEMEVQWKKHATHSSYPGGDVFKGATLSDTDYAINVDTTNCYASYRKGTPYTVRVENGDLTGLGVPNKMGSGMFLVNDTVNITPYEKKSNDEMLIPFQKWTSSDVEITNPTSPSNSFTVPGKNVTVTAMHSPFVGAPVFKRTDDSKGTIAFQTTVKPDGSAEYFEYVKVGKENDPYGYRSIAPQPITASTASPYEYSVSASNYYTGGDIKNLEAGDYRMAVTLNGERYLSDPFTVNYTAPVTTYTVSFDANGGTGAMTDVTDVSGEYTLPANGFTAPAGKQFKAWSVGGSEKAVGDKITVTANTTVTAVWENTPVVTYTVSFDANGGTGTMADVTGVSGEYTLPANGFTAPAGKQFKAWSVGGVEKAAGDKITVTANTTVTAVWENTPVVTYTVSFDANGGTGTMADVTGVSGEYTLPANGFTAPAGKQFKAWSVGGSEKAVGDKITVTANTTVTAVWENIPVVTYTVSFAANGGTGTMADVTGVSGEYTLPANGFTAPAGKQFKAWSVGGSEKAVGDKITVTANTTVTAVWENTPVVTYTVSFDANGGTGTMADVTGVSGEYTLPANGFTAPAGKQFKAWSVGGVEKAVGDKITVTANTTVTAVWENTPVVTYTVSFDANGGTGTMADVTGVSGEYTLPANGFTAPAGKQFKAWSVGGVEKAAGDTITVNANTTVTAIWESKEYSITVTDGKATIGAGSEISKAAEGTAVTLTANAAPSGKVFDKWVVKAGGVTLANETSATTTFTMSGNDVKIEATYKDAPPSDTPPSDTPPSDTPSNGVYVGMTYTAGNLIYQITSIDTATVGQSKVIGVVAAKKNKIKKVTIPDRADYKGYRLNVTTIGNNAFAGCKALKKLTIGNKVTVIGKNAFKKCSKLETVVIGKAVKIISSKAFIGDNKIKKITFKGKKLKTVNKDAFSKKAKKNIKSKKTKLKGNKKAIKLFKKKLKIK